MSVSINVRGLMSPEDKEYQKHLEIVEFCNERKVSVPKETAAYFQNGLDGENINDLELEYAIEKLQNGLPIEIESEGDAMYGAGLFIDVSKIPEGVTRIQVYCS